jgi:catechol 2,3-dioxygenase-like lactoylglutathione lyase family enzyme
MATTNDHIGLSVGEIERISEFYCGVFGMTSTGTHTLADGVSRISLLVGTEGVRLELTEIPGSLARNHTSVYDGARTQGWFHWALRVDDLDTTLGTVTARGGHVITGPTHAQTRPGITFAYVTDPEGNLIEVITAQNKSAKTTDHL